MPDVIALIVFYRYLIVTKCDVVSPALEAEYSTVLKTEAAGLVLKPKEEENVKVEVKSEGPGILLKPKQEFVTKSAHQIVHEQSGK